MGHCLTVVGVWTAVWTTRTHRAPVLQGFSWPSLTPRPGNPLVPRIPWTGGFGALERYRFGVQPSGPATEVENEKDEE
jgi:hypothetical protein